MTVESFPKTFSAISTRQITLVAMIIANRPGLRPVRAYQRFDSASEPE